MMIIEQLYTQCLAEAAYYIESEGECAIIDPLRECSPYLERAGSNRIRYIFETHFHADFVSGHLDLARKTGAEIIFGPGAETSYAIRNAADNEEFRVGKLTIRAMHTPGHTPESTCWLLLDENGKEHCLFSGDTLFIGDVGRPDLAIKGGLSQDDLAGMLYDSIRRKIFPLPDDLIIYPAHGAGSSCGKNMSRETFDTLGHQKQVNYALREGLTREQFIREVTDGILPPPAYFAKNAALNRDGYQNIEEVLGKAGNLLGPLDFKAAISRGATVLDVRNQQEFAAGFIPGSVFIGLDGTFAVWVGTLIEDINTPLLLVTPAGREEETVKRLARVGYDNIAGILEGGFAAWEQAGEQVDTINSVTAEEFAADFSAGGLHVLDVRKPGEYESGHLEDVPSLPLDFFHENYRRLSRETTYHIHCAGGYRSMIYASLLKRQGYHQVVDVQGGFARIKTTGLPVVAEAAG